MKRILSMLVVCIMIVSMFTIGTSAYKKPFEKADEATWLLDFEDAEIDAKYNNSDAKVVANPDATDANAKVMRLAAPTRTTTVNNATGKITVPEFHFSDEAYVEFKVKHIEGDLPLLFKINDGTNTPLVRSFFEINLDAADFGGDNWYTVSLYVEGGKRGNCNGTLTVKNDATGEKNETTVSANNTAWGEDEYYIYYNIAAPAESAATTWLIDDIGFYGKKLDVYSGNSFTDLIAFDRADEPLNELNFEDVAIDTKYSDAKVVANPAATEDNKNALLLDAISRTYAAATTHTGEIKVPEFHFAEEVFVQFRVMLETGDVPLTFTLHDGTETPLMKSYFDVKLDPADFEDGKWYTVALHVKDGKSKNSQGTLYVYDEPKGEITSQVISCEPVWGPKYEYFIKYSIVAPENNQQTKWYVDDIGFYDAKVIYEKGMFFNQDFEDATNIIPAYNDEYSYIIDENGNKVMRFLIPETVTNNGNMLGEANWIPTVPDYIHNANDTAMIFSFDVKKENDSYPITAYVCNDSYTNRFGFMIPPQQLREDVWYTYALVVNGNSFYYYRKAEDAEEFEPVSYMSRIDAAEKGFDKVEGNTDVENPIISDTYVPGTRIKCIGFSMHNGNGTSFDVFNELEASIPAGSSYLIDNVKLAELNDLRADIKKTDEGVTAIFKVNENRIFVTATKVVLVYFDGENKMIGAKMADVEKGKAEVSMSAADTEAMVTANVLVWDENNVPVMSNWDVTEIIKSAE